MTIRDDEIDAAGYDLGCASGQDAARLIYTGRASALAERQILRDKARPGGSEL